MTTAEKTADDFKKRDTTVFSQQKHSLIKRRFKFASKNAVADKIPRVVQEQRRLKNTPVFVFILFKD